MIRGVLGGTFDPVHIGHVAMASYALGQGLCHFIHVIPAHISPHKVANTALPADRSVMTRLAFSDLDQVAVDDREINRSGPSFTVDTLEELEKEHPDDELLLILGQDNLAGLQSWKNPERLAQLARVAVLARPLAVFDPENFETLLPAGIRFDFYPDFHQPVSATAIRAMLSGSARQRDRARDSLPAEVAAYIYEKKLYLD